MVRNAAAAHQNGLTRTTLRAYNRLAVWGALNDLLVKGRVVLKDSLGQLYRKVIFLQARLILLVAIAAFFIEGQKASLSAFVGGAAVLIGGLVYSVLARESKVVAISGKHVLCRHVLAEVAKTVAVLSVLLGALTSGWFVAGWLVAAMGAALLGHWLAVLIIR